MMTKIDTLSEKSCIPCQGSIPPLAQNEIDRLLGELPGKWLINGSGHLYRKYTFRDFLAAMEFANTVGEIAEREAHHPDLTISWGACAVEIWTHKINGLTESDFILAAKIDRVKNAE